MDLHDICTFVIPFRIDSKERLRNLRFVLKWIEPLNATVILLEADKQSKTNGLFTNANIKYTFVEDANPIFHRTHYINQTIEMAATEIVAVLDTDIIVRHSMIYEAIRNITDYKHTIAYPYDTRFVYLSEEDTQLLMEDMDLTWLDQKDLPLLMNRPSCGGIYLAHKKRYLALGGENERFIGWGPEDAERLRRVTIMGGKVSWTATGRAYHLSHPRHENSNYFNEDVATNLRLEFIKVCSMNKDELSAYIKVLNSAKHTRTLTQK